MADTQEESLDPTRSKVGRLIEEHGLDGLGSELEAYWTADNDERMSLRALAEHFNVQLLRAELEAGGQSPTEPDLRATYETLTGDDVSRGVYTRKRRELEREGVDVERLENSFVTHQAVHTYLTKYRDAEHDPGPDGIEGERETIARLRSRTTAVTDSTLDRLANAGHISDREYEALVEIRVLCQECGRDYTLDDLFDQGGCSCS